MMAGCVDGSFSEAQFHYPRGMAFASDGTMLLGHPKNSSLRKVDFRKQTVTTLQRSAESKQAQPPVGDYTLGYGEEHPPPDGIPVSRTYGIALDENDNVFLSCPREHKVLFVDRK